MIVSGEYCGYLDPQEQLWKGESGKIFRLEKLQQWPEILAPFDHICSFQKGLKIFSNQTLFRFPLRNTPSDISDKCYSNLKFIQSLIEALREEVKYLLLFLRSVESITITELLDDQSSEKLLLSVKCDSLKQRIERKQFIDKVCSTLAGESPYNVSSVVSSAGEFDVVVNDQTGEYHYHWLVVHQVGSTDCLVREKAAKEHVLPWVGAAIEVDLLSGASSVVGGRLFCFLPMPCETTSPIPIHVNGTFALSDNRRALKWPAAERRNDPQAEWNKLLVEHCLPSCYVKLVLKLIKLGMAKPDVYNVWPNTNGVKDVKEWSGILLPFFCELFQHAVVHSNIDGGKWIKIVDAVIVAEDRNVSFVVEKALLSCRKSVSRVNHVVWNAFDYLKISYKTVTPKFVRLALRTNLAAYQKFESSEKLDLLRYCLKDEGYSGLTGLELLPLVSGAFIQFNRRAAAKYVCSAKFPQNLLPDCLDFLVDLDDIELHSQLENIAKTGYTQLKLLCEDTVAHLLKETMPSHGYPNHWLQMFWSWVKNYHLRLFENLPIVPIGEKQVAKLTKLAGVVYLSNYSDIRPGVVSALHSYQVKLACCQTHSYLSHRRLFDYLHCCNAAGILDAMSNIHHDALAIVKPTIEEANALQGFLSTDRESLHKKWHIVCQLTIFCTLQCKDSLYSLNSIMKSSAHRKAFAANEEYGFKSEFIPPTPLVLSWAGNQNQLLGSVSGLVHFINKLEFLCKIILPKVKENIYTKQVTEDLMTEILQNFYSLVYKYEREATDFVELMKTIPFVTNSHGLYKCPKEMFDPKDSYICSLFAGEPVFPVAPYDSEKALAALHVCGLRTANSVTATELLQIVDSIKTVASKNPVCANSTKYKRAKAVVKFVSDHPLTLKNSVLMQGLKKCKVTLQDALEWYAHNYSWLPVCSTPPSCYPPCLQWKGSEYRKCLISATCVNLMALHKDINMSNEPIVMGSEAMFVEGCLPQVLAESISPSRKTQASAIINHLCKVIEQKDKFTCDDLENVVKRIYAVLNQFSKDETSSLSQLPAWILVERYTFVSPSAIALSKNPDFGYTLEPFIYVLPNSLTSSRKLFRRFGMEEIISPNQILSVLNEDLTLTTSSLAWTLVVAILKWAEKRIKNKCSTPQEGEILVPAESSCEYPQLHPAKKLVYTDSEHLKLIAMFSGENFTLVHSSVTNSMAQSLGVTPLTTHLDISEDIMTDAGQHEPLVQRLKNILREYKDGLTIIKELLQNADDAGATELNILYDGRYHSTSSLFFKNMDKAHGPALVVHNNAMFTDEDFINITKLAGATKIDKPLKIGKFGLGFCSVYHITDVPSFVSRDLLYIFDPSLKHLAQAVNDPSQPGKRVKFTSTHFTHSQQLLPYNKLFNFVPSQQYEGTIFRFPFREFPSEISSEVYNEATIDNLRERLRNEGAKMILFLKNVNRITFSMIHDGECNMTEQLVVQREDVSISFDFSCQWRNLTVHSSDFPVKRERWLVSEHSQKISLSGSRLKEIKYSTASVACQVVNIDNKTKVYSVAGEVFCFLPLSVSTGLPVHVSANFGVISNRRGIWTSDSSNVKGEMEVEWNVKLMKETLPQAYLKLLKALKHFCEKANIQEYSFYCLWPLELKLKSKNPWENMVTTLYDFLCSESLLFSSSTAEWLNVQDSKFLDPQLFSAATHASPYPQCVVRAVQYLRLPVVFLPSTYRTQLENQLQLDVIKQENFVFSFFTGIDNFKSNVEVRNSVLLLMLQDFSHHLDNKSLKKSTSTMKKTLETVCCIPCTPHGHFLAHAEQLLYPSSEFSTLFDPKDGKFPIKTFCEDSAALRAMEYLGLIKKSVPWSLLIECASRIEELYKHDKEKAIRRVRQVLDCIEQNTITQMDVPIEAKELSQICFLPVMAKPESYPLSWKGSGHNLLCGSKLAYYYRVKTSVFASSRSDFNMPCLVGTQLAVINTLPPPSGCGSIERPVQHVLGLHSKPKVETVLKHFFCLLEICIKSPKTLLSNIDWVNTSCRVVYKFFENCIKESKPPQSSVFPNSYPYLTENQKAVFDDATSACKTKIELTKEEKLLSAYQCTPFIFTGYSFVLPSLVALDWKTNGPYLYSLPDCLATKHNLTKALAIRNRFEVTDLFTALKKMHKDYGSDVLPKICHKVVDEIMQALNTKCDSLVVQETMNVYLPDESYHIRHVCELSFNDAPWCQPETECILTHRFLLRKTALAIGVKLVRSRFLDSYAQQFGGSPFGQREELTIRIKNILHDYPLDATFLKELIQNADDAKANKMCVILDKRKHPSDRILSEHWSELQGPALLVWNDAVFSKNDLKGIQQLGLGSKRGDSESIGQFGIGFNVVYHITDCPSFITGGKTLCILDPHCRYVEGATPLCPGRRFDSIDDFFWQSFSDLKDPYLRNELPGLPIELQGGSLFRFPLRHKSELVQQSELVENKLSNILDADTLANKLQCWVPQVKDSLLFLNHLSQFQYFIISESSSVSLQDNFIVHIEDSYKKMRTDFQQKAKQFSQSNEPITITYPLSITSVSIYLQDSTEEKWLVQQGVGDMNNPQLTWSFINQTVPKHGIASLLLTNRHIKTPFKGKAFCFLPLPNSTTNLPVHVNGQFVLNSNRRSLWRSDKNDTEKESWNDNLVQAIASSYAHFLVHARKIYVTIPKQADSKTLKSALDKYYHLFPYWNLSSSESKLSGDAYCPEKEWKELAQSVFKRLLEANQPILASIVSPGVLRHTNSTCTIKWSVLQDKTVPFNQAYFLPDKGSMNEHPLKELLVKVHMTITCAPYHMKTQFGDVLCEATPNNVFQFYLKFHKLLVPTTPCPVSSTCFGTSHVFITFTRYICTLGLQYPQSPFDCPLCPLLLTADEHLRAFDKSNRVLRSKYSYLFPNSSSLFLHPGIAQLGLPSEYYAEKLSFEVVSDIFQCNVSPKLASVQRANNVNCALIKPKALQDIWKCLCFDPVISCHQKHVVTKFTFLPANNQVLFSADSKFLPLVFCEDEDYILIDYDTHSSAFELLKSLGMPILDDSLTTTSDQLHAVALDELLKKITDSIEQYCADMSNPPEVLKSLYYYHFSTKILNQLPDPARNIETLFDYFSNIHFKKDASSLRLIKSLPLFKAMNGKYTSIQGKMIYLWPFDCCKAGYNKWADSESIVFLEKEGAWKTLCSDITDLGGNDLELMDVYRLLIFNSFHQFDASEREEHLRFIRDQVLFQANYQTKHNKNPFFSFLQEFKELHCLEDSKTSRLLRICDFCDPRVTVFKLFPKYFNFLSEEYSDDLWLIFFEQLGLKNELTENEFVTFCCVVAEGNHSELSDASDELLKYLFSVKALKWLCDTSLLSHVKNIPFVKASQLPELNWIKAPCLPRPVNHDCHFTTLCGAAHLSCARLVWTVRPVVNVPHLTKYQLTAVKGDISYHNADEWNEDLHKRLGIITHPSVEDVYRNIIHISNTGLAKFNLFNKYDHPTCQHLHVPHLTFKDNIVVEVISDNLNYLQENDSTKLKELETVCCIPVNAEHGVSSGVTKPVLVNSLQVVHSMDEHECCLRPYISVLPQSMMRLTQVLSEMGVTTAVKIKHLQYLLQVIHDQIGSSQLHTNHHLTVRTAVTTLLQLCSKRLEDLNILTQLYLPCLEGTLMLSTQLVALDSPRYSNVDLDLSNTNYRVFYLPPDTRSDNWLVRSNRKIEKDLNNLPEIVRPKSFLLSSEESILGDAAELNTSTPLCEQIFRMKNLNQYIKAALPLFLFNEDIIMDNSDQQLCILFADHICKLLETLQVKLIKSLYANVHLTLTDPPALVGTKKVPFLLSKQANGSFLLYINADQKEERYRFWKDLSLQMCIVVAKQLKRRPTTFLKFSKCLADFLKVKDFEDFQALTEDLSIQLHVADSSDNQSQARYMTPKLGRDIPEHILICLDQDINHIFRGQEWVGYEIGENHFVFAFVLHRIFSDDCEETVCAQMKYLIQVNENEDGCKIISALDLYKIIEKIQEPAAGVEPSFDGQVVSYIADSAQVTMHLDDDAKLLYIKRRIISDLKMAWQVPKCDRKKAIKRLYLNYHPDKADYSQKEFYEEAFKFLMRQIDRLDNGLDLEDPSEPAKSSIPERSSWRSYYAHWEYTAKRTRRKEGRSKGGSGDFSFSSFQPKPNEKEARRWLIQAEADFCALCVLRRELDCNTKLACNVCFTAHQVVEKALKAGMYKLLGLNPSCLKNHNLKCHAHAIHLECLLADSARLPPIASSMENHYVRSRYPNMHSLPDAPVDVYSASEAEEVAQEAEEVLGIIQEVLSR